ncbi:hypothetical protein N7528_005999 [Penicillium herquei]|nr:hypothetical protein N7528_005999 [Penicillium herquei]
MDHGVIHLDCLVNLEHLESIQIVQSCGFRNPSHHKLLVAQETHLSSQTEDLSDEDEEFLQSVMAVLGNPARQEQLIPSQTIRLVLQYTLISRCLPLLSDQGHRCPEQSLELESRHRNRELSIVARSVIHIRQ